MITNIVNVLHLTDLHFGADRTANGAAQRQLALDGLERALETTIGESVPNGSYEDWRPHVVVVSGDIAYSGSADDYNVAAKFLERLRSTLGVPKELVVLCPGNHDRSAKRIAGIGYPSSANEADLWLSPEQFAASPVKPGTAPDLSPLWLPFRNFVEFAKSIGAMCPDGIAGLEYLTGTVKPGVSRLDEREIPALPRLNFLVMNSAWFCKPGGGDLGNVWLGLPLLEELEARGRLATLARTGVQDREITIGVLHHPREWLNPEERDSYSDRPNTFRYLAERCDLLLSGHVHSALEPLSVAHGRALVCTGGATYVGDRFRNNFSLLQINLDDMSVRRRGFEHHPRVPTWQESSWARGAFPLPGSMRSFERKNSCPDLGGAWESVYWIEGAVRIDKGTHQVTFERQDSPPGADMDAIRYRAKRVSAGEGHSVYEMDGLARAGMFSGIWKDTGSQRHGVFHLRIEADGSELRGRWLGYDRYGNINVGTWKFSRASK